MQLWAAPGGDLYFASDREGETDIFHATHSAGGDWVIANVGSANSAFVERFPFVSFDDRLLLFASDRPGGAGSDDLYVCHRLADGTWGAARSLG